MYSLKVRPNNWYELGTFAVGTTFIVVAVIFYLSCENFRSCLKKGNSFIGHLNAFAISRFSFTKNIVKFISVRELKKNIFTLSTFVPAQKRCFVFNFNRVNCSGKINGINFYDSINSWCEQKPHELDTTLFIKCLYLMLTQLLTRDIFPTRHFHCFMRHQFDNL